jgi:hypothetical protein
LVDVGFCCDFPRSCLEETIAREHADGGSDDLCSSFGDCTCSAHVLSKSRSCARKFIQSIE